MLPSDYIVVTEIYSLLYCTYVLPNSAYFKGWDKTRSILVILSVISYCDLNLVSFNVLLHVFKTFNTKADRTMCMYLYIKLTTRFISLSDQPQR